MAWYDRFLGRKDNQVPALEAAAPSAPLPMARPIANPMLGAFRKPAPKDAYTRYPQYLSAYLSPEKLMGITRQADIGYMQDQMGLLQEIAGRDGLIQGLLTTRLSALSRKEVVVEPSKSDPNPARAEEVAAFCQEVLSQLRRLERSSDGSFRYTGGLPAVVELLSMASWYGVEMAWVHWGVRQGDSLPRPIGIEPLDERRFGFEVETNTLTLATQANNGPGQPVTDFDPALWIEVRNTRVSRVLSQCGSGRAVLLPFTLRLGSLKDLLTYAEVWALPGVIGKMSNEVAAAFDQNTLASFETMLREFAGDSRQILPPGFDVQVMSAVSGGERVFDLLDKLTERQIQFAIVGQVGTASGDQSTYASADVGMQVQNTLVAGDERMVSDALERLLLSAVTLRFGKGVPAGEVMFRARASEATAEDKAKLFSSALYPLISMIEKGIPVDVEAYAKLFDLPVLENTNDLVRQLQERAAAEKAAKGGA